MAMLPQLIIQCSAWGVGVGLLCNSAWGVGVGLPCNSAWGVGLPCTSASGSGVGLPCNSEIWHGGWAYVACTHLPYYSLPLSIISITNSTGLHAQGLGVGGLHLYMYPPAHMQCRHAWCPGIYTSPYAPHPCNPPIYVLW